MTIRRNARETFELDRSELAGHIREVLRAGSVYRDTVENGGASFTTNVKPNPLFSETAMRINLEQDGRGTSPKTVVDVTTVSQSWATADVFGFYDAYIRDFLAALRRQIEGSPEEISSVGRLGLPKDKYGWMTFAFVLLAAALFVALPAALAVAGLEHFALSLLFHPVGVAVGFALASSVSKVRRRFGTLVAVLVAVVCYVAAIALFVVLGFVAADLLLDGPDRTPPTPANGLLIGVLIWFFLRSRPEGYEGEVSEARDVRGLRGIGLGYKRWLLGGPMFPRNFAILALALVPSIPLVAFGALLLLRGAMSPTLLVFPILGLGNIALGFSETLALRPSGLNTALRVVSLLCLLTMFPTLVLMSLL